MYARSHRDRKATRLTTLALFAALVVSAPAGAQTLSWTGAVQGASGKYIFPENTNTASVSNGIVLVGGPLVLSATMPIVYQSTPWISQSGMGVIPTGGTQSGEAHGSGKGGGGGGMGPGAIRYSLVGASATLQDTTQYDQIGFGDPMAFASLRMFGDPGSGSSFHLTGAVKAPVASVRSGFGTGEWDFGAGGSLSASLGPLVLGLDATKWWLGDMPGLVIKDPVTYGTTVTHLLSANTYSIFATFWGASKTFDDTDAPRQVGIGGCRMYGGACSLGITVSAGLSNASPDIAVGMSWQVPLGR